MRKPVPKYWQVIEESPAHRAQLNLIPSGSSVLEVGPGGGHMSEAMAKKGCTVTAIEKCEELAEPAQRFCEAVIIADIERMHLAKALMGRRFDVVLLGDVLEHLQDPGKVLSQFAEVLLPSGFLVVSVPNVAHGSVRLALLHGRFEYGPVGLLDESHLRFFTHATLHALFERSGWSIQSLTPIRRGIFDPETEIATDPLDVPLAVLRFLSEDRYAEDYQFVFRAVPRDVSTDSVSVPVDSELLGKPWNSQPKRLELSKIVERASIRAMLRSCDDGRRARRGLFRAFRLAPRPMILVWFMISLVPLWLRLSVDGVGTRLRRAL